MEHIDELKSKLREKNSELKNLRIDYQIIMENYKANLQAKSILRKDIKILYDEYKELKNGQTTRTGNITEKA